MYIPAFHQCLYVHLIHYHQAQSCNANQPNCLKSYLVILIHYPTHSTQYRHEFVLGLHLVQFQDIMSFFLVKIIIFLFCKVSPLYPELVFVLCDISYISYHDRLFYVLCVISKYILVLCLCFHQFLSFHCQNLAYFFLLCLTILQQASQGFLTSSLQIDLTIY